MNKKLISIVLSGVLLISMVGCKGKAVDNQDVTTDTNANTSEVVDTSKDQTTEETTNKSENTTEEIDSSADVLAKFDSLEDKSIKSMMSFVDKNIQLVDKASADKMVIAILKETFSELDSSNAYLYGSDSLEVNDAINVAVTEHQDKFNGKLYMGSNEEYIINKSVKNSTIKNNIKEIFSRGHGLISAEGSYYATVDYPYFYEKYSSMVSSSLSDYLKLASVEVQEPTMVEEYLAISIDELKKRVVSYETFLKEHKDFEFEGEVRILYMSSLWKVINPNMFDDMLNEDFTVKSEIIDMYNEFKVMSDYPVLQHAAKGILEFVNSRENGVVGSLDNMDELYDASYKLQDEVGNMIDELYINN